MIKDRIAPFNQLLIMAPLLNVFPLGADHAPAAASAGACHNFSILWLKMLYADSTANLHQAGIRMDLLGLNDGRQAAILQKMFANLHLCDDAYDRADDLCLLVNGLAGFSIFNFEVFNRRNLCSLVTDNLPCSAFLYSFEFSTAAGGAQAHTIAFFRRTRPQGGSLQPTDTIVSCFDPNYGEYNVQAPEFERWFTDWMQFYGTIDRHRLKGVSLL